MEDWVHRALERWPNVPALFGWLGLDHRGRWLIRGQVISRPQIIDTLNRNYAADEHGRWYFQNGPQRGYVDLAYTPYILQRTTDAQGLQTHTGQAVRQIHRALLDEEGSVVLVTEHGPAAVSDAELDWLLARIEHRGQAITEIDLAAALEQPSGQTTPLTLRLDEQRYPLARLDRAQAPAQLGFDPAPQPRPDEAAVVGDSARAPD